MDIKRVYILTKYVVKNQLNSLLSVKKLNKYNIFFSVLYLFIIILFISALLTTLVNEHYKILKIDNSQYLILEALLGVVGILSFLTAFIGMVLSMFNFDDAINLLPMPVKVEEILFAKFITSLIYQYIVTVIIIAPLFLYNIMEAKSFLFYVIVIIIAILFPIVPNCMLWIVGILFLNFGRRFINNINVKAVLVGFLFFSLPIIQLITMNTFNNSLIVDKFDTSSFNLINDGMISNRIIIKILNSELKESIVYLIIFLLLTMFFLFILYVIGNKIYLKNIMSDNKFILNKAVSNQIKIERYINRNSTIKSLIIDEFKTLVRTPAYFLNCIMAAATFPIIWYIGIRYGVLSDPQFIKFINSIVNNNQEHVFILIICIINIVSAAINPIAYTSLDREGNEFYYKSALPIKIRYELIAKYISSIGVNLITIIMIIFLANNIIEIGIVMSLWALFLSIIGVSLVSSIGILLNIKSPRGYWSDKELYFKGNMNAMKIGIMTTVIVAVTILLIMAMAENIILCLGIITIIYLVLNYLTFNIMINSEIR